MSIDNQIIRLEHDTEIVPIGSEPGHCQKCACAARGHGIREEIELSTLGGMTWRRVYCRDCGARVTDSSEGEDA